MKTKKGMLGRRIGEFFVFLQPAEARVMVTTGYVLLLPGKVRPFPLLFIPSEKNARVLQCFSLEANNIFHLTETQRA